MTRDELLATVHVLEPGDLLFVRLHRPVTMETVEEIKQLVEAVKTAGVDVLVAGDDVSLEQYRRIES